MSKKMTGRKKSTPVSYETVHFKTKHRSLEQVTDVLTAKRLEWEVAGFTLGFASVRTYQTYNKELKRYVSAGYLGESTAKKGNERNFPY